MSSSARRRCSSRRRQTPPRRRLSPSLSPRRCPPLSRRCFSRRLAPLSSPLPSLLAAPPLSSAPPAPPPRLASPPPLTAASLPLDAKGGGALRLRRRAGDGPRPRRGWRPGNRRHHHHHRWRRVHPNLMRQASAVAVHDGYVLNKPLRRSPLGGDRVAELMRPLPRCSAALSATRSRSRSRVVLESPRGREAAARTHRHVPTLATQTKTRGHQASSLPSRSVRDRPSSPPQAHLAAEPRVASAAAAALHAQVAGRRRLPRHAVPPLPCPGPLLDLPRTPYPAAGTHPSYLRHAQLSLLREAKECVCRLPPAPPAEGAPLEARRAETRRDAPRCAEMRRDAPRCVQPRAAPWRRRAPRICSS